MCQKQKIAPYEWSIAIIKPILKKGDRSSCENYRCISLSMAAYKIYILKLLHNM
jgi:hypothetical protein